LRPSLFAIRANVARVRWASFPLFLWPAGLAVGLAPKERRYGPNVRFAPGTAFDAAPLVPPLHHGVPQWIRQVDWAAAV